MEERVAWLVESLSHRFFEISSPFQPSCWVVQEDSEHLASNEPFEAAQVLPFREPLFCLSLPLKD